MTPAIAPTAPQRTSQSGLALTLSARNWNRGQRSIKFCPIVGYRRARVEEASSHRDRQAAPSRVSPGGSKWSRLSTA